MVAIATAVSAKYSRVMNIRMQTVEMTPREKNPSLEAAVYQFKKLPALFCALGNPLQWSQEAVMALQMNPVHSFSSSFCNMYSNIILPSASTSSKPSISFRFYRQNPLFFSPASHYFLPLTFRYLPQHPVLSLNL